MLYDVCAAALPMSAVLTISWSCFENVSPVLPGVSVSAGRVPVVFQEEKTPTRSPCCPSAGLSSLPPPGERDGGLGHGPPGHQTQADICSLFTVFLNIYEMGGGFFSIYDLVYASGVLCI